MKNLKINLKKICLILSISTGMSLIGGCSKKPEKVNDIIVDIEEDTCLDELLKQKGIDEIDELLDYVSLSKELYKLKLTGEEINLEDYKCVKNCSLTKNKYEIE